MIEAKKACDEEDIFSEISKGNGSAVNEVWVQDFEANNYCRAPATMSSFNMNYPSESASAGMSFVYDTTTNFSNESLLDFLETTNYSRNGASSTYHLESFGSVDNFCLDDFY